MRNTKKLVSKSKKRFLALGLAMAMAASSLSPMGALPVFAAENARAASKNNANGATVAGSTLATLQGMEYNSLAKLVARSYYTSTEKLNKQTEIFKRGGYETFAEITEEMVLAELNVDDLKVMSFEAAYAKVQADLDTLIPLIVQNSEFWGNGDENTYFTNTILDNKEKLMLGLTYVYRLYDFNIGDVNIKDKIFEDVDYFGKDYDQLQWLITLGGLGGDALKLANNINIFNSYFANKVTNSTSVTAFIENEIAKNSGLAAAQWFVDESNALIVERESDVLGGTAKLYNRLKSSYPSYILPILNVSESSVYVVSTPGAITFGLVDTYVNRDDKGTATYDSAMASFESELNKHADLQTRYLELWTRIAKEDDHGELVSNRVVLDGMRILGANANAGAQQEWSPKVGDTVSLGVEEFFAPMNIYTTYTAADAQADTNSGTITFWMAKAIGDKGLITYTHELTHLLVNSVWLNDYNSREGLEGEFFTRGLFETFYSTYFDPQMSLNMILDYSNDSKRIYNKVPERFQNTDDLKEFTQGMMDVLYTLDYMEAQAILGKSATEKAAWFHQLNQKAATRQSNQGNANAVHTNDNIVSIDETLAATLVTLEDLIENNMVTSRHTAQNGLTTGEVKSEEYHSVPMFSANYAVAQNDNGASGAFTGRRMAFDLLAEFGYYEGLVPYVSNQYRAEAEAAGGVLSDTYIFEKIWGNQYADAKAFKKAMYDRRAQKLNQLKPITINVDGVVTNITSAEQLQNMMNAAVVSDLPGMPYQYGSYASYSAVEKLKAAVYTAYIQLTDDFTTSIYTDEVNPTAEPTAEPTTEPTETPAASEKLPVIKAEAGDAEGAEPAGNAIDGYTNTLWHTNWYPSENNTHDTHWLQVELDDVYAVSEFKYLPRQSSTNGIITSYKILVSVDGQTFTEVKAGDWAGDSTEKSATFAPVNAKYVRLQTVAAMSDQDNAGSGYKKFASAAEVSVYGGEALATPTEEPTPSVTEEPTPTEEPVYGDYPMAGSIPASDATVTTGQPFAAGTANSNIFRIPCLITLDNGNLLGAADIRYVEYRDFGGIDTIAAVSADDGATWKYSFPINFPDSDGSAGTSSSAATYGIATTAIDPIIVQGADGTIYCMADMNPSGITTQDKWPKVGTGYVTINGVERLALTSNYSNTDTQPTDGDTTTYEYYVGDFDENGFAPVLKRSDNSASGYGVDEWFNLYGVVNGRYVKSLTQTQIDSSTVIQQNAFYKDSVLHVYNTGYIWLVTSNDGGMTWDNPQILNTQVKRDNETALLVSPGRGLVTSEGDILVGCYNAFQGGTESASAFYLKAGSTTWQRTSNDVMNVAKSSENEIVELYDGTLRMFYRSDTMKMCYADITKDANGNYVMGDGHELGISISSNCNISAIKLEQTTIGGKPVVLTSVPEGPGSWNRVKGRIYVFTINEDNTMNHISTYKFNEDTFAYSCMTELEDGNIGILWEPGINQASAIRYSEVAIADIIPDTEKDVVLNVGEKYKETIISDAPLTVGGTPNASVAKVQINTTEGEKLALCDKGSTTANTALTLEGAGLTFTETGTENVWKITTNEGLYMVNRQSGGPVTFFQSAEGTMTVTPDGTGAFNFMDTTSGRHTMFFTTNVQFNAMSTNASGAAYKYGLTLLEKQDVISAGDTLPGYKQVSTITSGKTYLITYTHEGTLYVMYPTTATSAWDTLTKTTAMVPAYENELVITGIGQGSTAAVIGNMTYNIKVNTGGMVEVRLKVGETYQAEGFMTTRPSEAVVGINEVSNGYTKLTAFDQLTEGKYLIGANSFIMKNEGYNKSGDPNGLGTQSIDTNNLSALSYPQYLWTIKAVTGGYTVQDANGQYLGITATSSDSAPVVLSDTAHVFEFIDAGDGKFYLASATAKYGSNAYCLNNFRGDNDNIAAYAAKDNGAKMFLYKAANPEITLTAEHVGETIMVIGGTTYKITVYDDATPTPPETVTPEPPAPEGIVVDFGLPTMIHLEPFGGDTDSSKLVVGRNADAAAYGTVDVAGDTTNGWDITYTPNAVLQGPDTVTLTAVDGTTTHSFKVYPANTVYYEESFMTATKGTWNIEGNEQKADQEPANFGDTKNGAANYGYDAVYENWMSVPAVQLVSDSSTRALADCEYTFVNNGTTKTISNTEYAVYTISAVNADGTTVYLNSGTSNNKSPNQLSSLGIAIVPKSDGKFSFVTVNVPTNIANSGMSYLHCTYGTPEFDRCSGDGNHAQHNYEVYKWTGNTDNTLDIRGYERVTALENIVNGGSYIIVYNNNGTRFVLNPASGTAATDFTNTNKAKHIARLNTTVNIGTEYVTTNAGTDGAFDASLANAEAAFTFTGTGVDVYANCEADTGMAMVLLSKVNADNTTKIEKVMMVDTKLNAGPIDGQALTDLGTVHNIPIVSLPAGSLEHGTYKVAIVHATSNNAQGKAATTLKLDGFRVYGTLSAADETTYYTADKEANVVYNDMKDSLLAAWTVNSELNSGNFAEQMASNTLSQIYASGGQQLETASGAILLDSQNAQITYTGDNLKTYLDTTSKNEVYLYPGQSLQFSLTAANVNPQIALKSLNGSVSYSITSAASGQTGTPAEAVMKSNTEMYYALDMAENAGAPVQTTFTITNRGNSGVLAVTKLKVVNATGTATYGTVTARDVAMALISLGFASEAVTPEVTETPAVTPTVEPTTDPTVTPTVEPTTDPTVEPTVEPTTEPTETEAPAPSETEAPTPSETPEEAKDVTEVFSDVHADWYTDYVQYVYDNGLMTGIKGTDRFEPNANITKAQVAQVLYNMEGQPMVTNLRVIYELSDIPEIEWYTRAVAWAYNRGIVTGDTNAKKFFPNADVTREQLALMMYRYAEWKKYDVSATSDFAGLENAENVSNWAAEGMRWAVGSGLISGVEKDGVKDLDPQGNATRAQMAAILQRFCDGVK